MSTVIARDRVYTAKVDADGRAWIQSERFHRTPPTWVSLSHVRDYPAVPIASISLATAKDRLRITLLTTDDHAYAATCPLNHGPLTATFLHQECTPFTATPHGSVRSTQDADPEGGPGVSEAE
ncbi:hypothetical protein ACFYXV_28920 [Streptomyces sp. NPDC002181]|uniref:hypothetical protein n=1 Tax=Streptomyces sp. NPDC002181 TaxID=3364635 RepID=UPI00368B5F39